MLTYSIYPKRNKHINHYGLVLSNNSYFDSSFHGTESESEIGLDLNFQNSSMFHVSFDHSYYDLFLPFDPWMRKFVLWQIPMDWHSFRVYHE